MRDPPVVVVGLVAGSPHVERVLLARHHAQPRLGGLPRRTWVAHIQQIELGPGENVETDRIRVVQQVPVGLQPLLDGGDGVHPAEGGGGLGAEGGHLLERGAALVVKVLAAEGRGCGRHLQGKGTVDVILLF